jgi:glycosyltransferase involved in cell wall biosynthesis
MIEIATQLDRRCFNPELLTTEDGPLAQRFRAINAPVYYGFFPFFSRRHPWIYWGSVWNLARQMREKKIDLVHVNCDRAVPHAALAGKLAGVPILCNIHDVVRAWFLPRYVRYLNMTARIVVDSQATALHCLQAGMKKEKLQVIYECFEMERYLRVTETERKALRSEWGLCENEVAIGLVGQVLRYKGHEEFIQAAATVMEKIPAVRFYIVGDDMLSDEPGFVEHLREKGHQLGLDSKLTFTGFRDDIPQVMSAMDIIVAPSYTEGFGRVVVEALAAGRVVVATRVGGIPEIVKDGETGFLVQPRDVFELVEKMIRLVENPELRRLMGEKGPVSALRFDVGTTTRLFEDTYQAILDKHVETLPKVPFGEPTWV